MVSVPTAADLKTKLPFFASVDDTVVTDFITEAGREIDDDWLAGDQENAAIYLAAHLMYVLGATGASGAPPGSAGGGGAKQSESIDGASVSYAVTSFLKGGGDSSDELRSTVWGRQYLRLVRRSNPGVLVV